MRQMLSLAACAVALTTVTACGEERGPGGLTSEEARKLDEHANRLDSGDIVDASPDSLVANGGDEWMQAETGQTAPANGAANALQANGQ